MLKARGQIAGRETVIIGLSFRNLQKFKDAPLDTYIQIKKGEMDLPFDILLFSAETEQALEAFVLERTAKQ